MNQPTKAILGFVREVAIILVIAIVISATLRAFVLQAFYVPSSSMESTLLINDRIVASKLTTRFGEVKRGDVIVFKDPGSWLPEPMPPQGFGGAVTQALTFVGVLPAGAGKDLVKRAIAIGGDRITCCDAAGKITLNGEPLDETQYLKPGVTTEQVEFDLVVPADHIFVMGDNRPDSRDSRYHLQVADGAVPESSVVGRAVLRIWPLSRIGTLPRPAVFDQFVSN
jgi:signal peptidase I